MPADLVLADLRLVYSGKVRDLYALPDGHLLFVASDRISAYDHVLPTPIPDKGRVLTQLSLWWFEQLADVVPNHVVSLDVPAEVEGRAMVCERLEMLPVECVVRGYLTGSGLAEYVAGGAVCGVPLPPGLVDGSRLPEPIFTPATKAALGEHDENVSFEAVVATVGRADAEQLRRITLAVYDRAEAIARDRGIVLADTKLELGRSAAGGTRLGRRGADTRLLALLAARSVGAGTRAAVLRQAVRPRLAHVPRQRLGPRRRTHHHRRCRTRSSRPPGASTSRPTSD